MPINAYTGLMGSGKSYECVSSVIVPAVKAGRRVVTNVDGIDSDAIRAYCVEKWSIDPDRLGHVVHCRNDDVAKQSFLPHGGDADTFCKRGDIICIDEAWRFWGTDCKLLAEHKVFFREHRHFVDDASKVCCDLVLMVQDISDLHRTLKVVVEVSFRTTKIKTLGWQRTYRVEMWEGYRQTIRSRVSVENKRYDAEIFPLYSSYVGGTGKELQVDGRQNVLRSPKLWILAVAVLAVGSTGLYFVLRFFNGPKATNAATPTQAAQGHPVGPGLSSTKAPSPPESTPPISESWRVAGSLSVDGQQLIALADGAGRVRLEHPSAFLGRGYGIVGVVDGQRVMVWSGAEPPHEAAAKK